MRARIPRATKTFALDGMACGARVKFLASRQVGGSPEFEKLDISFGLVFLWQEDHGELSCGVRVDS